MNIVQMPTLCQRRYAPSRTDTVSKDNGPGRGIGIGIAQNDKRYGKDV